MDVGTAKPDAAARAAVPHHLLDLVDPEQTFTVADWVGLARSLLPQIAGRGRLPMVVAGTGLYLTALVDGHDYAGQPFSPEIRERLAAALEAEGLAALSDRLVRLDRAAAERIDLRNPRRVLRALERAESGRGAASLRADPYPGRLALIGIRRPRQVLYRRIADRAERLFASGLLEETRRLLDAGRAPDLPALSGHGYREAAAHLAGELSLDEAIDATARRTRQYAKRQLTWFRRDPRIIWIEAGEGAGDDPQLVIAAEAVVRAALS
jgi:tRNA dimethylallyltransferase